ncbi:unnamed protein product [Heterobilharzia americana]|nr:unnamed protein product [Heterobilharzia americana]
MSNLRFSVYPTSRLILHHTKRTLMTTSIVHRSILLQIYTSLRKVFHRERPRLVGVDDAGTRYFEASPNKASEHPHLSKRPRRFYLIPGQKSAEDSFMETYIDVKDLPPEWQSWLNHRRSDAPTKEEIEANNLSRAKRLGRAAELEAKHNEERLEMIKQGLLHENELKSNNCQEKSAFPVYPDIQNSFEEYFPRKTPNEKQDT